jgi:hypothetical protein
MFDEIGSVFYARSIPRAVLALMISSFALDSEPWRARIFIDSSLDVVTSPEQHGVDLEVTQN